MAQQSKEILKSFFQTGFKPTEQNFSDLIDSLVHKAEEGFKIDPIKNLSIGGSISLGDNFADVPGSIRWKDGKFQFRNNVGWEDLNTGGGDGFTASGATAIVYNSGNVGIGTAAAPAYKLDVELAANNGSANQVRFGNATFYNGGLPFGNYAYFSHRQFANNNDYAIRQGPAGNVNVNAAAAQTLQLSQGGAVRATIDANGIFCIAATSSPNTSIRLFVNGEAGLPGSTQWVNTGSDNRLKENIKPFGDGLKLLQKLKPVTYKYNGKAGISTDKEHVGLIAQEVQKVFPYMVGKFKAKLEETDEAETDLLNLDTNAMPYIMINAIKELAARLEKLEKTQ